MTERLPRITADDIIRVLLSIGFVFRRQSGSHKIYMHANGSRVTVPYHSGKILHPKILKNILTDADLTQERLKELL